jgi:hypothetical protein
MKQKITASVVAKLLCPAEKEQAWVRDTEVSGFSVRITNKGIKSFVFGLVFNVKLEFWWKEFIE